jgi:hypothetical protein
MDVQPAQSRVVQFAGLIGQQHAVGGERQVRNAFEGGQLAHQRRQIFSHQRLASGDAQLSDAQSHRDANEPLDFFKGQNLLPRLELHVGFRHAVKAADVAAIRHAEAQTVVKAAESVDQRCHRTASILSMGARARSIRSGESSTRGRR